MLKVIKELYQNYELLKTHLSEYEEKFIWMLLIMVYDLQHVLCPLQILQYHNGLVLINTEGVSYWSTDFLFVFRLCISFDSIFLYLLCFFLVYYLYIYLFICLFVYSCHSTFYAHHQNKWVIIIWDFIIDWKIKLFPL